MYVVSHTPRSYCYRPRSARHGMFDMVPFFEEPMMQMARPRRSLRSNFINFEDLMPFRNSTRFDPFQEINQMMSSIEKNWNQPNLKIENPENLKIKIDQDKNLISIRYEDDNSFYESTRSLPKYIQEVKMHQEIKCQILDGELKMILPEKPEKVEAEAEKPKMIEITPEIKNSEETNVGNNGENAKPNQGETLEVEVVNE